MSKKDKKSNRRSTWDPQKDNLFKELAGFLTSAGFDVRREELKQGPGWKVMSGACRYEAQKLVFVDKKLPQDEQISFLLGKIVELKVQVPDQKKDGLPENVRSILFNAATSQAA